MLVADDDDDVFEETDAALARYEDESPPLPAEVSSEAAADHAAPEASDITHGDFSLLPLMREVVTAHQQKDPPTAQLKMAALRRAVRRAETRLAVLSHATSEAMPSLARARTVVQSRSELLKRSKRQKT